MIDRKGNGTAQEFTFRTSGGSKSLADDGTAIIKSIHGNTIALNQLCPNNQVSKTALGVTFTNNHDGSWTINGTATGTAKALLTNSFPFVEGHKYLVKGGVSANCGIRIMTSASHLVGTAGKEGLIVTTEFSQAFIWVVTGTTVTNERIFPQIFDLTQMFGAGNEPSTVAEFNKLFSLDYYAYGGSLLSFNGTGIKTVGFNQMNANGKVNVFSGLEYEVVGTYASLAYSDGTAITLTNNKFTASKNDEVTVTGFNNTTCVHLTWSGYRNGEYEAYWTKTLSLPISTYFPTGMRSVGTVYDELLSNKAITRIREKAFSGTETWERESNYWSLTVNKTDMNGVIEKDLLISNGIRAQLFANTSATNTLRVYDNWNTGRVDSTTNMNTLFGSSCKANYELATPTEVAINPPLSFIYQVSDFGTEQLLPVNADELTTTPFKGTIAYLTDFAREIANLPKNYQSQASMDGFSASLGSALGISITKTWDSINNKYNYTIPSIGMTAAELNAITALFN